MEEISAEQIINKAKDLNRDNKVWHFHMLGKQCKFNENKGKFCLILEEAKSAYFCLFDEKPAIETKMLAELVYGKSFLEKEGEGSHNPDFDQILERAKELKAKGIAWHHHHLKPQCIFNQKKGKNCIVLEDPETNETLSAVYDGNPMKDLTELERLFYS